MNFCFQNKNSNNFILWLLKLYIKNTKSTMRTLSEHNINKCDGEIRVETTQVTSFELSNYHLSDVGWHR